MTAVTRKVPVHEVLLFAADFKPCVQGRPAVCAYYAVKKIFVKFFAKFFEVFAKFFKVFASFLRFSRAFRGFRIHSDPLGCIRMHSEAIGSVWTFSKIFEIFWIFESFFNVSGRNFHKRLFSRHNSTENLGHPKILGGQKIKIYFTTTLARCSTKY